MGTLCQPATRLHKERNGKNKTLQIVNNVSIRTK